jgi:hypothetical protein
MKRLPAPSWKTAFVLLCLAILVAYVAARDFGSMRRPDEFVPTEGFARKMLSEYFPPLKGTDADTPVFIREGKEPGGTVLILGGTHPVESAGILAATVFLENASVSRGRLIVIPNANAMALTHNSPQEGHPQRIALTLRDGSVRTFRYGSRATNSTDEWPFPEIYVHPASGQKLSGKERSNLNRCYPGVPDGSMTERLAYAIVQLIRKEKVDLAFDLHEASPEYPVVNAIVAHERSMELAAMVAMELEGLGIPIRLEPSPKNLRGLSHREWGDATDVLPILMETGNPSQGRLRGRTDERLVLTGEDKAYTKAAALGRLFIPYGGNQPIAYRVARHVTAVRIFVENLDMVRPGKGVTLEGIPGYEEILKQGVESFLKPVPKKREVEI